MSSTDFDPDKASRLVKLGIAILTAILGFLTGMGSASAACLLIH